MKMLAAHVLVDPERWTEAKIGSIFLPENSEDRKRFARGTVKAVGPGLCTLTGAHNPIDVKVGDHVLYYKADAINITVNERDMHIVIERALVAILEPGDFGTLDEGDSNASD